ncbi:DUF5944 family protein [Corynebacterium cystitidis]|nr:DUF5944 family protein [Corynebacterium cystitidis]
MKVLTNADFLGSGEISAATREKLSSKLFPHPDMIRNTTTAERMNCGVRISHTSVLNDLTETRAISHRFHFIDRMETRERFHVVTPDDPSVTTTLLVMFEEGQSRDYFSISTYDSDGMIVATETFVYNDEGRIVTYPFKDNLVSPIVVGDASIEEVSDSDGNRLLKFEVHLDELEHDTEISLLWESIGSIQRHTVVCGPDSLAASILMPLDENTTDYPCDWVAIAVDEQERVLAQAHFALEPN